MESPGECLVGGPENGCQQRAVRRGLCWTDYRFYLRNGRPRTLEEAVEAHCRQMIRGLARAEIRRALVLTGRA